MIEFRGEIFILKKKLDYINNYRKKNNMHPFNSGRNFIIGIVKLHNYNPIYNNILNYYIYDSYCYENDMIIDNHYMNLNIIKKYGLNVSNDIKLCNDINQINNYIDFYSNIKNKLDFYIDGIVIKINQYKIRSYLGVTSKYPKWAIAYKYNSEVVESTLNAIYYQVGRTGLITPIAKINPIKISGTIISSINLYNHVEISKLDLRVNDHVYIQKGGEIIPKIIGVNFQKRNQSIQFIHVNNCPSCNYILKRYNNLYYCNNSKNCTMQIINQIVHFISKDAMNIRDINFHTIKILYENKILKDYTDLFNIEKFKNKILNIKGFSNLFLDKLIYNINLSKNVNFKNFIFSLGINYVGIESAKKISYSYSNIHLLINAKLESLMKIPNIGEKTANSIVTFFHKKNNIEKIDKLMQFNIKIQYINNNQKRYILNGKIFVISGVFENYSRNKLNSIVIDNGGIITKNVSHKVSYIIGGKNMGPSKVLKAKKMKINIISIDFFLTMIKNDNIR
ncbi:MAG: NAD-dependent DNA ligase LigA [Bacteroides sp.]|nr:MAG: NAD-dependent DNA ligase LigA [Bacteroides sp.]